jgi:ABC-type polysaccharide/polyol phosphate export permease
MTQTTAPRTNLSAALNIFELIFHSAVRNIRKENRNAIVGLLSSILQAVIFVAVFYVLLTLLGMRRSAIRGDFMLYILSGVYLFLTHNKALLAVAGSGSSTNSILNHAPLNTMILIAASALSVLYLQILALLTILFCLHVFINPITIDQPIWAFMTFLMAWGSGVANGLLFLAARPWAPGFVNILKTVYTRANMISSGKMFVANSMPLHLLVYFSWNPLFHTIDQARGFIFINYNPHNSDFWYPIWWIMAIVVIGLMAEFFTRRHASSSWGAGK